MQGGTTFQFVTDGFEAAIDEIVLTVVPVVLGDGERLFDGPRDPGLEPIEVVHSPHATHIRYRVGG